MKNDGVHEIELKTGSRTEMTDITRRVREAVQASGIRDGLCVVYVPHTTAAVTINENADPSVARDITATLTRLVPAGAGYAHAEGNADAHIKAVIVGASETVLVRGGELVLGTWQGIFFCEFDGPRFRKVHVKVSGD
jgi:secondary thiamine-phosphate synthase enzyme